MAGRKSRSQLMELERLAGKEALLATYETMPYDADIIEIRKLRRTIDVLRRKLALAPR